MRASAGRSGRPAATYSRRRLLGGGFSFRGDGSSWITEPVVDLNVSLALFFLHWLKKAVEVVEEWTLPAIACPVDRISAGALIQAPLVHSHGMIVIDVRLVA